MSKIQNQLDKYAHEIMNNPDTLTQSRVDEIMTLAHSVDPTESNVAAEMRDMIRDNNYNDLDI